MAVPCNAENQLIKLPADKYTVREREMLIGSGILPKEFFEAARNPFVIGVGAYFPLPLSLPRLAITAPFMTLSSTITRWGMDYKLLTHPVIQKSFILSVSPLRFHAVLGVCGFVLAWMKFHKDPGKDVTLKCVASVAHHCRVVPYKMHKAPESQ
eukprot:scaffold33181_cov16-Tisochrysis_lutea.AAC.2